ncbi:unnamed protein product [Moneuplotes crassus]|uniref:Uncharacterized protein n=1 Tax=Euplotes crassus TaxID=5936 RepID=A0AAD1U5M8_EUPCR|nr:unnamed protein product [Moneuplotes crassus]
MAYQNPFSAIPILRVNQEQEAPDDRESREKRVKRHASKYFVDSDEDQEENKHVVINKPQPVSGAKQPISWPSLFKNFEGSDDDKKRALIHVESLLDQEKIKGQENQQVYHKNEKIYLSKISKLESDALKKEKSANDFKTKAQLFEGKLSNLTEQLSTQKAENLILKEERDEIKGQYTEEIDKLKQDLKNKSKTLETCRNDLAQAKDNSMRFETSLRNKDAEVVRLQMQLDREKEIRDREERELRKQINYESEKHINAVREAERNLSKFASIEDQLEMLKREIDRKDNTIQAKETEIDRLKQKNLEQERKFNDVLNKEKDALRDEMMFKLKEKSQDHSIDDYKRQILSLTKQNEDLIAKTEGLLAAKETLAGEITSMQRAHNDSVMRIKELNLKYETHIADLEKKLSTVNMDIYKKEALIAKITTENEHLCQENFKLKNIKDINDSLTRLPETCFIDLQSAKKQREAIHEATKSMIDEMAEEKAKGKQDLLLNNIAQLEEKNKKLYLDMYENIGANLNKYEIGYNYKNKLEMEERQKHQDLKDRKERAKTEFQYKLDTKDSKRYEDFLEDQVKKNHKASSEYKIEPSNVDSLLSKYNI